MDVDAVWIPVWILVVGFWTFCSFGIYLDCAKRLAVGIGLGWI